LIAEKFGLVKESEVEVIIGHVINLAVGSVFGLTSKGFN
jgi:hypothetical protein